jgi:hypothetical protein
MKRKIYEIDNQRELNKSFDRFYYSTEDKERTRFMNIDEIITLLIRMNKTEDELLKTTNYKNLLEAELKNLNYKGKLNNILIIEYLDKNNIIFIPMNEEMKELKQKLLNLREARKKEWEEKKNERQINFKE